MPRKAGLRWTDDELRALASVLADAVAVRASNADTAAAAALTFPNDADFAAAQTAAERQTDEARQLRTKVLREDGPEGDLMPRQETAAAVADALLEAADHLAEASARLRRDAAAVRAGRLIAVPYAIGGGRAAVQSASAAALAPLAALEAVEVEGWNALRDQDGKR